MPGKTIAEFHRASKSLECDTLPSELLEEQASN